MEPIFEGTGVALVLPMFEDGSIDYEGYKRQVQRMIDGGVKALLVNGTTGEPATIDIEDEFELTKITVEMAKGTGVKVIVGAGSNYTAQAIRKAKFNAEAGADANLVVTPYYNKTSQRGLIEHYKAVAAASDLPLIMYNVPGRTGMKISVDTVVELAKVPNIVAMKDATDDIAYAMEVLTLLRIWTLIYILDVMIIFFHLSQQEVKVLFQYYLTFIQEKQKCLHRLH